jgi:integrase
VTKRAGRRGHGEGSVFQLSDGRWRAMVDLGWVDGKRRRKAATRATRREAVEWLREAQQSHDAGALVSKTPTVAEWFAAYLDDHAAARVRPRTLANYRRDVERHVLPTLGRTQLDKLRPEHLTRLYRQKTADGLSPATVRHLHAVIRAALGLAVRWGRIPRNVALLVEPPASEHSEITPLTVEEARALLTTLRGTRPEARWVVGLSLGLRQGEALGLWWEDVDFEEGVMRVRRQLLRPVAKGAPLVVGPVKSARSKRTLALPAPLAKLLREHRARQVAERLAAGGAWPDERLVFTTSGGTPVDHRNDAREFKALCERAGIPPYRVHDLRHTAATLLIAQGQHARVIMEVLGHSQIAVTMNVYGHVMDSQLRDAADAVTEALWGEAKEK